MGLDGELSPSSAGAELTAPEQRALVDSIRATALFGADANGVQLLETHISYVLLSGAYAYKIKKAVNLEFLDFTTLAARRRYCLEELRLNRLLASSLYLDVLSISGTPAAPSLEGAAIEYAVKMRRFDADALLSDILARGGLTAALVDQLAATVSAFHERTSRASSQMSVGRSEDILQPAVQNFDQLAEVAQEPADRDTLEALRNWTIAAHEALSPLFEQRRLGGFVRECHGDLHLGNIALVDGQVTLFDRIEFNEAMRWIDVMNDVAFVVMDLEERQRPDLAARFLNDYVETTGDYDGLRVLPFYVVYRSMVRAKVERLRLEQLDSSAAPASRIRQTYRAYLACARRHSGRQPAAVVITCGLPGSGKSSCAQQLVERAGAVRIRTDVERKRLHHLGRYESSRSSVGGGLYTPEVTRQTYERVRVLTRSAASSGFIVVVDGSFQEKWERQALRATAAEIDVPFVILEVTAPDSILRARIQRRAEAQADASEATLSVLDYQQAHREPLSFDERRDVISWDTAAVDSSPQATAVLSRLEERLARRVRERSSG